MGEYTYDAVAMLWVKICPKCDTLFQGKGTREESEKVFSKYFAQDSNTIDGFYGVCRQCVGKANQARRNGRDDCVPEDMLEEQEGKCGICNGEITLQRQPYTKTLAYVDHNHQTGKVRGLLCHRCNSLLGVVEDREWLAKAEAYLARYENPKN